MLCQRCKSQSATVCVSKVVNSQKIDIYLCRDCANKSAAAELKKVFPFLETIPGHFVIGQNSGNVVKKAATERCTLCGKTLAEIYKDGKVGCAVCYMNFKDRLRPSVLRIHRNTRHRGKKPHWIEDEDNAAGSVFSGEACGVSEVEELRAALNSAIVSEEYEKAAEIRDKIKLIKNGI